MTTSQPYYPPSFNTIILGTHKDVVIINKKLLSTENCQSTHEQQILWDEMRMGFSIDNTVRYNTVSSMVTPSYLRSGWTYYTNACYAVTSQSYLSGYSMMFSTAIHIASYLRSKLTLVCTTRASRSFTQIDNAWKLV